MLRLRRLPPAALASLDAVGIQIGIATCLTLYATNYATNDRQIMLPILIGIVTGRAVTVPSSGWRTFLLGLTAPLGILAVQAAHGTAYYARGHPYATHAEFVQLALWSQATLLFGLAIATLASRITYGLRRKVREAQRMGDYRLGARIGSGAMGEVYHASHERLRRPAAVKLVRREAMSSEALARFEREVQITSSLTHPNTVAVYDYGRAADGTFYYAMEYLDGADLARVLDHGALPPARAIHVLVQVCGALEEAPGRGLVHRDIKPSNILLCYRGGRHDVAKVVDFGLVKDLAGDEPGITRADQFGLGTPQTMAPEVAFGGETTVLSDQYSLAVVGYEILTGTHRYDFTTHAELYGHLHSSDPVPLRRRNPDVPADLEAVVLRALSRAPADRFEQVAAFRAALEGCADAGRWTEAEAAAWWAEHYPAKGSCATSAPQ